MAKIYEVGFTASQLGTVVEALLAAAADAAELADEDFGGMAGTLRLASEDITAEATRLQAVLERGGREVAE